MNQSDRGRFSDDELIQFHADFLDLTESFKTHELEEAEKYRLLIAAQQDNATAIRDLTAATSSMVEAWGAAQGAVKLGATLGKFTRWLASVAIVGSLFAWLIKQAQ